MCTVGALTHLSEAGFHLKGRIALDCSFFCISQERYRLMIRTEMRVMKTGDCTGSQYMAMLELHTVYRDSNTGLMLLLMILPQKKKKSF